MKPIDLRGDTVTLPTPAMREAMYRAEVGDDYRGEDPTVNRLQEMAAEHLGKEAALFMPSGTMCNLAAMLTHCERGQEVIVGSEVHIFHYEVGGASALGGLLLRPVPNDRYGGLDPQAVEAAIRPDRITSPSTGLICLENTHYRCGGTVLSPEQINAVCEVARRHSLPTYLDGSRIFNAAVYLGIDVKELVRAVDSLMFCLSKGLSAPAGSLLVGSRDFIRRARKTRQMLGGGMYQTGVLAAAGIVALEQMVDRLADDHRNARLLAEGLNEFKAISIDLDLVQTNVVDLVLVTEEITPAQLSGELSQRGVLMPARGETRMRAITHYGIEREDIETTLKEFRHILKESED